MRTIKIYANIYTYKYAKVKETMQKYVAEKNVNGQVQAFIKCWLVQLCLLPF